MHSYGPPIKPDQALTICQNGIFLLVFPPIGPTADRCSVFITTGNQRSYGVFMGLARKLLIRKVAIEKMVAKRY
jgi:hypothetical protein